MNKKDISVIQSFSCHALPSELHHKKAAAVNVPVTASLVLYSFRPPLHRHRMEYKNCSEKISRKLVLEQICVG